MFALFCYSNATCALIANPPNIAQLGGIPYHSPKLHPGPCNSVGMRPQTDTEVGDHNTFRRLAIWWEAGIWAPALFSSSHPFLSWLFFWVPHYFLISAKLLSAFIVFLTLACFPIILPAYISFRKPSCYTSRFPAPETSASQLALVSGGMYTHAGFWCWIHVTWSRYRPTTPDRPIHSSVNIISF